MPRRFEYSYEIWINDENEYSKLLKIIFFDIWDVIRRPLVSWWYWLLEWRGKQELTFMQGCFPRNTVWTNVKGIGNWDWQTWKSFRETPKKKFYLFNQLPCGTCMSTSPLLSSASAKLKKIHSLQFFRLFSPLLPFRYRILFFENSNNEKVWFWSIFLAPAFRGLILRVLLFKFHCSHVGAGLIFIDK